MKMRGATLLALLVLAALPALAAEKPDPRIPTKKWYKGPVGWIMTDEEQKEFKKLKTDEERDAFARTFWEKRDPTPDTPVNEFEIIFWQKVEAADQSFKSMLLDGSVTDMGRVFILLGPPTSTTTDSRNRSIWVYEPNPITGITEEMQFSFARTNTGMLLLEHKDLEKYVEAHPETLGIGWTIPVLAQADEPQLEAAPEVVEDTSPESQRQIPILESLLASGEGPHDVPFEPIYDYYKAADGSTLLVLTVEVPRQAAHGSGDSALLPFARLEPVSGEGRPANLTGALPFVPAPVDDCPPNSFIYQARRNLQPGTFKVALVVEDKVMAGEMGTRVETVEVPDYREPRFEMSSVSLLAQIRPVQSGLGPDEGSRGAGPYILGSYRMVPRAKPELLKEEALSFYYQVYNPEKDPASGRPNLEATYTFYLKEGTEWKPFRRPIQKAQGQVEIYSIDLKDLLRPNQPLPAEFKMVAKLEDKIGGQALTRDILFTVR